MIIRKVSMVPMGTSRSAHGTSLRRFHNTAYVQKIIREIQILPFGYDRDVKKQAEQIRYCLQQAREYSDAATAVSLATKPLLLYYCIMSLALAEVLLKQSGDSSLDRAREQHKHHGLVLRATSMKPEMTLVDAASCLAAERHLEKGCGVGTFELWHRSARHFPLIGEESTHVRGSHTRKAPTIIFTVDDQALPTFDRFTLLDCFKLIPAMHDFLRSRNIESHCARGTITRDIDPPKFSESMHEYNVSVHQTDRRVADLIMEKFTFEARSIDYATFCILEEGLLLKILHPGLERISFSTPDAISIDPKTVYFLAGTPPLNEFGAYYTALYILGNYARYYPDKWIADVENSTDLALSTEELLASAETRLPQLACSEMSRCVIITG